MKVTRRDGLRWAAACALWGPSMLRAAGITEVRVWPAALYTRVTLESDAALVASHQRLAQPDRLVIDLEGQELTAPLRDMVARIRPDDPFIAAVRVGQFQPRVVRLVLDLKQDIAPQVFALAPVAQYRHRLVLDLHPATPQDPLLAFLQEKLQADAQARRAAPATAPAEDALGGFIRRIEQPEARVPRSASGPGTVPGAGSGTASGEVSGSGSASGTGADRLVVVAIDPGHGGEDPGAVGPNGLREKDVVLSIGLQLRDRINAQPGMRAFMTRDGDYFVPLHERVRRARRVQADLMVSIHADAFITPTARGASVYALSQQGATSAAARWMAERENASDAVGGIQASVADAQVMRAMLDMSTSAQIRDSLQLGSALLGQIDRVGRLHKRQVEQAGFAVLKAPDIPSVLVETAFISNPDEERQLARPEFQAEMADALTGGIRHYFSRNPPVARQRTL